jgi:hypothetical protein
MLREPQNNEHTPLSHSRKRKIGTTVVAVITVFIAITAIAWLAAAAASDGGNPGTPSYRDTVGNFIEAINDTDVRSLFQLMPAELVDSYIIEEGIEKQDLMALVQQELDLTGENLIALYGEEWRINHEILETRELLEDELLQLQAEYEELELQVSEALVVDLALTFSEEEPASDSTIQILLLKIGGSWYITGDFLDTLK